MRREVPYNHVTKDYSKALNEFVCEIVGDQKKNVVSLYLTGSYARGDAMDTSDFDIFCIFKTLNAGILERIGNKSRIISEGHGKMPINPQCMTLVKIIYKKYMVEVLMSIRHYMSVDKPVEKLTHERIKMFILKPLMFALRLERFCTIGNYPLSIQDLLNSFDNNYRLLVEYFVDKEKFENHIKENHRKVLGKIHTLVSQMIDG